MIYEENRGYIPDVNIVDGWCRQNGEQKIKQCRFGVIKNEKQCVGKLG